MHLYPAHRHTCHLVTICPSVISIPQGATGLYRNSITAISRQIQFVMVCNITSRQQQLLCTPDKLPDKPPDKLAVAKFEFEEMEKMGIIRKSNSPWASPLHIVPKSNGGWPPCGDYRTLNDITTPDLFPIPYIQDFSIQLSDKSIFFQKLISFVATTNYQ